MRQYVRIISGADSVKMLCREWSRFVELQRADSSPGEGWYPVEKVLPKPEPGAGQQLAFSYTVRDGVAYKEYFLWPADRPLGPRRWSRLSIKTALAQFGMLAAVRAYLAEVEFAPGYTAAEALTDCDYIEEGYPTAERWSEILDGAAQALGKSRADIDAFLDSVPAEG